MKIKKIEEKINKSNLDVIKKALYFVIAPIMVLLIGIILLSTVGFSKGIDFTGGQTFKIYVNNETKLADAKTYNLDNDKDYNEVYEKITIVLNNNNVNVVSYQTTKIDLAQYNVYGGQAVQVTYQTNGNSSDTSHIRADLIDTFEYTYYDGAISSIDEVPAVTNFDWAIALMAAVVFGLVASIIYMAVRFSYSALFVVFIQAALDIFLTLGLMLICRVTVNLTVGIVVLSAFLLSLLNSFMFYNKVRENRKAGLFVKEKNAEMANIVTKQSLYKKSIFYICLVVASILFAIIATNAVSAVALSIMFAIISTFYSSTFILPSLWALVDKPKKEKKKV